MKYLSAFSFVLLIVFVPLKYSSANCSLPFPSEIKCKNVTSCSMNVTWNPVTGAAYYAVRYKLAGGNWNYVLPTTGTQATLTGLAKNKDYVVSVATICTDNSYSGYSPGVTTLTKRCSPPSNPYVTAIGKNKVTIQWTPQCNFAYFSLRYRVAGETSWEIENNITDTSFVLSGLQAGTRYEYRLLTDCGSHNSSLTPPDEFVTLPDGPRRNILFVCLDDARYDFFTPNGAPSWFNTPSISRIADEGVNFKIAIPTTSQCGPSRASIYTGLYPHVHGCMSNGESMDSSYTLIQQVLQDHGYYTGFIGKYGQSMGDPEGFDWWAVSQGTEYVDADYEVNGRDTVIQGNIIDVYPRLAKEFLSTVPEGRFFALFYFTRAPHDPTVPRTEDITLFTNKSIPFPSNYKLYKDDFPSFYLQHKINPNDTSAVIDLKLRIFQTIAGIDNNMDSLFSWLELRNWVDSTLIIFTSDNGFLLGEHKLDEKSLALEESIRVPLFMRYPAWFNSGTEVNNEIASNIDFSNTFLDLAGISNTYGFQGISLKDLASGTAHRKSLLYEFGGDDNTAPLRAIRNLNSIYIRSYCTQITEEFYDLSTDPKEDTNKIFNSSYQNIIDQNRLALDSLRQIFSDIEPVNFDCHLVNDNQRPSVSSDEASSEDLIVLPSLASSVLNIFFQNKRGQPGTLTVFDMLNYPVYSLDIGTEHYNGELQCSSWNNGVYYIEVRQGGIVQVKKIVVNH